ncbi:AMP-binding protein [Thiohalorhabdus methylotrophus]|uniref:AMP-binding protein n=1 Tax=Thiohalorhabdus methylotrophus TaxID=3242694 RepID=A0ABV4TQE9_9GAMM
MLLSESALFRVLRDLVTNELPHTHATDATPLDSAAWTLATALDGDRVGADSLDLTTLATAVNERFRIHEVGIEDFLLRYRTLGDWVGVVREALKEGTSGIGFRTSGTTGPAKLITHPWEAMEAELQALVHLFPEVRRVVALAPAHHIYGFLYTAALPDRWGVPVLDGEAAWATAHSDLQAGDLVVTFPERWRYLASVHERFPAGVRGVCSTAPLPEAVFQTLLERGLHSLLEVYGATETGGVGYRTRPGDSYTLLAHWNPGPDGGLLRDRGTEGAAEARPMDHLRWTGARTFIPEGRADGAVQVGGTNVHPGEIARRLREHAWVAEATVRPMAPEEGQRLKAHIVLTGDAPGEETARPELQRWIDGELPAPQRPRLLTFATRTAPEPTEPSPHPPREAPSGAPAR